MPKCKNCGKEIDKDIAYKVGKASIIVMKDAIIIN